jgi:hypothetical protein
VVGLGHSTSKFREFIENQLHLSFEAGDGQPTVTLWEPETVHYFDRDEQRIASTTTSPIPSQPDQA